MPLTNSKYFGHSLLAFWINRGVLISWKSNLNYEVKFYNLNIMLRAEKKVLLNNFTFILHWIKGNI